MCFYRDQIYNQIHKTTKQFHPDSFKEVRRPPPPLKLSSWHIAVLDTCATIAHAVLSRVQLLCQKGCMEMTYQREAHMKMVMPCY